MKYELVLFDIDDTLFDFKQSQAHAFHSLMRGMGREKNLDHLHRFRSINLELWHRFEQGLVPKGFVKTERFRVFSEQVGIELDPHTASETFLNHLCETVHLIEGAEALCNSLLGRVPLGVITNGVSSVQHRRIARSPLSQHFDFVVVSEECGFQKPRPEIFEYALRKAGHDEPSTVLMVGDRWDTDIRGAVGCGMDSCWFNPESLTPPDLSFRATHTVSRLQQLQKLLQPPPRSIDKPKSRGLRS